MLLLELFDSEADWEWTDVSPASMNAIMRHNGHAYDVSLFEYDHRNGTWIVEFSDVGARDAYEMTNRGDAAVILSTVVAIIRNAIERAPIKILAFEAKEPSRRRLYAHIVKRMSKDSRSIDVNGYQRFLVPVGSEGAAALASMAT